MFKNKKIDSWVKKIDKIVTWVIIGSAIASILGFSQTKKWKEMTQNMKKKNRSALAQWIKILGKILAFLASLFSKKK